jgi:aromatic-L-amino-acid decarboxylase
VLPDEYTVYVSSETHSSMEKAVRIAGLGTDAVRIVEVDGDLAMRPAALAVRLERDTARGYRPVARLRHGRQRRRPRRSTPSP